MDIFQSVLMFLLFTRWLILCWMQIFVRLTFYVFLIYLWFFFWLVPLSAIDSVLLTCSCRFHSLVEFDDRKRSCRKRLDGHNRRRRKPQPATMTLNAGRFLYGNQGLYHSLRHVFHFHHLLPGRLNWILFHTAMNPINYNWLLAVFSLLFRRDDKPVWSVHKLLCAGPRFLPFGNQLLSASNDVSSWIGTIKPENNVPLCSSNSQFDFTDRRKTMLPGSLASDYKEKELAISCIPIGLLPKSSDTQPFLNVGSSNDGNVQKVLGNGSNRFFDSTCALSLLSTPVEPGEINISSMVQSNPIPPAHFIHSDGLVLESDPVNSGLVSDGSSDANIRCYTTFQDGPDGSPVDLFRFWNMNELGSFF